MELNISINWNYELENEDVLLDSSYSKSLPWSTFKFFFGGGESCIVHSQHTHPHMQAVWGTNMSIPWVCTLSHNGRLFIFLTHLGLERENPRSLPWPVLFSPTISANARWASGTTEKHLDLKSPWSLAQMAWMRLVIWASILFASKAETRMKDTCTIDIKKLSPQHSIVCCPAQLKRHGRNLHCRDVCPVAISLRQVHLTFRKLQLGPLQGTLAMK